ncbi:MAG: hypothetical protein RMY64_29020 [Nostoc sp. DedQUE08]|uniref:hypothetical protein n=1 Tax=unclassified Nostoc TaxID=2593658 RepID=UPI002AD24224|nr:MULTISPECIES: hypothetical protein [unclassified Nostoc]MDZ8069607.1 hypothetical protein [Nostoc sp. DedQUE08]MDZ8140652.1 hypothetical protein [Nostoc sp. DedQUE04]
MLINTHRVLTKNTAQIARNASDRPGKALGSDKLTSLRNDYCSIAQIFRNAIAFSKP